MTPYQRLLLSSDISNEVKEILNKKYVTLDPFELRKSIETKLKHIFRGCLQLRLNDLNNKSKLAKVLFRHKQ